MFDSKFTLFAIGFLILCLVVFFLISGNMIEGNSKSNNTHDDDVVYIWMMDENGELKLIPSTKTHSEGQGSAPG